MNTRFGYSLPGLLAFVVTVGVLVPSRSMPQETTAVLAGSTDMGASVTLLPDGRVLVLGGEGPGGPQATAAVRDPVTGEEMPLAGALYVPRAWHSATVLANGSVLVLGGIGSDGQVVDVAEVFDPRMGTFRVIDASDLPARASHTATLLTDGRVLIAGGIDREGEVLATLDLWDPDTRAVEHLASTLSAPRYNQTARLLADGRVYFDQGSGDGGMLPVGDVFDPATGEVMAVDDAPPADLGAPRIEASDPADGATDVVTDATRIVLRFSTPMRVETVGAEHVTLIGPDGGVDAQVVPAGDGMLVFVTPRAALRPGAAYAVTVDDAWSAADTALPHAEVHFTTRGVSAETPTQAERPSTPPSRVAATAAPKTTDRPDESWTPTKDWKSDRAASPWQQLPALQARAGVTAVAGQVLRLDGEPLANVTLAIDDVSTQTDETGRFLLQGVHAGRQQLVIDGRTANRPGRTYGVFEYGMTVLDGETNVLGFTSWMPVLDTAHTVELASPTTGEVVVTTPKIQGLELHIPAGSVIRDDDGNVVTQVGITPIPLDRPPFPLPRGVDVPLYFTVQPGRAYIYAPDGTGARLIYPNSLGALAGTRFQFWDYDADERGWYVYGLGTVTEDGRQVVPDPKVTFYEFTGAMVATDGLAPANGPAPARADDDQKEDGEPVDLGTGLFVYRNTDLAFPDVLPIAIQRTYRPGDTISRAFGLGTTHVYDTFLVGDTFPYTWMDVVLPDGGRVHYTRVSSGSSYTDAVMEHTGTPTIFQKTQITWDNQRQQWVLTFHDGTVWIFAEAFGASRPMQGGLVEIRDRHDNTVHLTRNSDGDLTGITSPSGYSIALTYDTSHRVTQAQDSAGRTVGYAYDGSGRLVSVTDPTGGVTQYSYDTSNRMATLRDARGIVFLNNEYDATGKVIRQTQADGTTFQFAYTLGAGGKVIETDVTDPRGQIRRVTFNDAGYPLTDTRAVGMPVAQGVTYERDSATNRLLARVDALNRRSEFAYDVNGNLLSVTRLAGTANAATTIYTYEPTWSQLASVTDPLMHTTNLAYDAQGNPTTVIDPLDHQTTLTHNGAGQPTTITTPAGTTKLGYAAGALASITDPMGNTTTGFTDGAGRLTSRTSPLGRRTRYDYDGLNRLTRITDSLGAQTAFGYDANGDLLNLTDAQGSTTSWGYDEMDRRTSRTDPLTRSESITYDTNGDPAEFTDRKGQITSLSYDPLGRVSEVTYADGSTTTYTWDAGNRLTQVLDSSSGIITRTYDLLDRLTQETNPEGTVSYTYDGADRRTAMTVAGQPTVTYTYDTANRLTQINQGSQAVLFAYDAANRRTSLTLPNGVITEYTYDAASRLTGLTYRNGATILGTLTYAYDADGQRVSTDGTWARTTLPQPIGSASYDANNRLTSFGSQTLTYDLNGNVTSDGSSTYTWDARNHLTAVGAAGLAASFGYDALGRRREKTINGTSTWYLHDGSNPVQENELGRITNALTGLGVDEFLARMDASGTEYNLADALGSTVALSDDTGAVRTAYAYEPFGATTVTGDTSDNPYQFTGRENDGTGLYFHRARYFHPVFGRFISEDPLSLPSGGFENLYAYVGDDPLGYRDPSGLYGIAFGPSGSAEAGLIGVGGGGNASANVGVFWGGQQGVNWGAWGSAGFFLGGPGWGIGLPPSSGTGWAAGASVGGGFGMTFTNARCSAELRGPFDNMNYNIPLLGALGLNIQIGVSGAVWNVSVTSGIGLPGFPGNITSYPTNTAVWR
jgi:RHS repeat-associated protein